MSWIRRTRRLSSCLTVAALSIGLLAVSAPAAVPAGSGDNASAAQVHPCDRARLRLQSLQRHLSNVDIAAPKAKAEYQKAKSKYKKATGAKKRRLKKKVKKELDQYKALVAARTRLQAQLTDAQNKVNETCPTR
jgi:hypothetical protein